MASIENIDLDWENFCEDDEYCDTIPNKEADVSASAYDTSPECVKPKCSPLYISTKTKICYLNKPIDLKKVFWEIPVIPYYLPTVGVVKKQIKFNSTSQDELNVILSKINDYEYVDNYIISQIINPEGRIKFKDIRKISIGLCKKNIISYRCKKKSAFYNCFVVILRLLHNDIYKEINVKVFNTGKLEIPGIQDSEILDNVLKLLITILAPITDRENDNLSPLSYNKDKSETVLINSNFNCGYYINRDNLYDLLKYKYKISSNYDPCSYPGIQCSFYYDSKLKIQTGMMSPGYNFNKKMKNKTKDSVELALNPDITSVSFMIFRTGSMLIVGKCTETILYEIYDFLCKLFETEYHAIVGKVTENASNSKKLEKDGKTLLKVRKIRKKTIYFGGTPSLASE